MRFLPIICLFLGTQACAQQWTVSAFYPFGAQASVTIPFQEGQFTWTAGTHELGANYKKTLTFYRIFALRNQLGVAYNWKGYSTFFATEGNAGKLAFKMNSRYTTPQYITQWNISQNLDGFYEIQPYWNTSLEARYRLSRHQLLQININRGQINSFAALAELHHPLEEGDFHYHLGITTINNKWATLGGFYYEDSEHMIDVSTQVPLSNDLLPQTKIRAARYLDEAKLDASLFYQRNTTLQTGIGWAQPFHNGMLYTNISGGIKERQPIFTARIDYQWNVESLR